MEAVAKVKNGIEEMEVSTSELAAIIGKSSRWVRQLTREGVLYQVARGKYKLGEAIQAYYEHKTGENTPDNGLNYNREKALLTKAKRELEENKLRIMKGELHRSEDVKYFVTNMLLNARSRLLVIPQILSPKIIGKNDIHVVNKLLKEEIYAALNELSEYDPSDYKPKDMEFIENDDTEND